VQLPLLSFVLAVTNDQITSQIRDLQNDLIKDFPEKNGKFRGIIPGTETTQCEKYRLTSVSCASSQPSKLPSPPRSSPKGSLKLASFSLL
jgi:hypothetical protein